MMRRITSCLQSIPGFVWIALAALLFFAALPWYGRYWDWVQSRPGAFIERAMPRLS